MINDHLILRSIAKRCVSKDGQQSRWSPHFETRPSGAPQGEVGFGINKRGNDHA